MAAYVAKQITKPNVHLAEQKDFALNHNIPFKCW